MCMHRAGVCDVEKQAPQYYFSPTKQRAILFTVLLLLIRDSHFHVLPSFLLNIHSTCYMLIAVHTGWRKDLCAYLFHLISSIDTVK